MGLFEDLKNKIIKQQTKNVDMRDFPNEVLVYTFLRTLEKDGFKEMVPNYAYNVGNAIESIFVQTHDDKDWTNKKKKLEDELANLSIADFYNEDQSNYSDALVEYESKKLHLENEIKKLHIISPAFCAKFMKELNSKAVADVMSALKDDKMICVKYTQGDDKRLGLFRENHEYWISRENVKLIPRRDRFDRSLIKITFYAPQTCYGLDQSLKRTSKKYSQDTFKYSMPNYNIPREQAVKNITVESLKNYPNEVLAMACCNTIGINFENTTFEKELLKMIDPNYVKGLKEKLAQNQKDMSLLKIKDFMTPGRTFEHARAEHHAKMNGYIENIDVCTRLLERENEFLENVVKCCTLGIMTSLQYGEINASEKSSLPYDSYYIVAKNNVALRYHTNKGESTTILDRNLSQKMDYIIHSESIKQHITKEDINTHLSK